MPETPTPNKEPKKRAPRKLTSEQKIARLEECVAKMAHYSGQQRIMSEFGIKVWEPGKQDMSKWSNV